MEDGKAAALESLRKRMRNLLGAVADGMSITLARAERDATKLTAAAAQLPAALVHEAALRKNDEK